MTDRKVYIRELAETIDRRQGTIRGWERAERLPSNLLPVRDGDQGWRYWTPEQVEGIKEWMLAAKMSPGSGLNLSPEREEAMLETLRRRAA